MIELWKRFPNLTRTVLKDHRERLEEKDGKAHDFYHALAVANLAFKISDGGRIAELAWVAGLMHNTDHLFGSEEEVVRKRIEFYLGLEGEGEFLQNEIAEIIEAILHHGEINKPDDSFLLIVLKDADRLANTGPLLIIRCSQFRHYLPPFNPRLGIGVSQQWLERKRLTTIVDDIHKTLEWWEKEGVRLRIPKAREIGEKWFVWQRYFLESLGAQLEEMGVLNLPEFLLPED